jgi:hypothetical protein
MTRAEFFYFSGAMKLERAFLTIWPLKSCELRLHPKHISRARSFLYPIPALYSPRATRPVLFWRRKSNGNGAAFTCSLYTSAPGHWLHTMHTANLMQIAPGKSPTNQGLFVNYWTGGLQTHNFMGMVLKTHSLLLMHGGRHTVIMYYPGFIILAFKDRNLHSGQE